jgi:hypothetical protein
MPTFFRGNHTETAGTAILEVIPAYADMIPQILAMRYLNAGTAHAATIMRPIAKTATTTSSASGVSTLELADIKPGKTITTGADETLAANDFLIWKDEDGAYKTDFIASVSGSTVTMTSALPGAVENGAPVWALYEVARATHISLVLPVSVTTDFANIVIQAGYDEQQGGVSGLRTGSGDPLLLHIDNATAAGTLRYLSGAYASKSNIVAG